MERSFPTPTPPRLDLRIPAGQITVETADGADETSVDLEGPAEALENATVEQRGDTVVVEVRGRTGLLGARNVEVSLHVRCPDGAAATVRTRSADVTCRGLLASAEAASASGDVRFDRVAGDASVKTASGDLRVEDVGGDLSAQTASGDVAAGPVGGTLKANLVSGDLRVDAVGGSATVNSVSGDMTLDAVVEGAVTLQSVSGDVRVGVRRGSRVWVDVSTLSGDPESELDLGGEPVGDDGPLVDLRVKTVSGDVSIVRAPAPTPQEVA
jgi:DUF4097 and DUF4098 domain-containing protein YvlB